MTSNPKKTRDRIRAVLDRYLTQAPYGASLPLAAQAHHVYGEPISFKEALAATFEPFPPGAQWGAAWDTTWFRFEQTIPGEWQGKLIVAVIDFGYHGHPGFGAEGLVYFENQPIQGINPKHNEILLTRSARAGEPIEFLVEAAANPPPPRALKWPLLLPDQGGKPLFRLDRADLLVFDLELFGFYVDFKILTELMEQLADGDPRTAQIQNSLNEACNALDLEDIAATYQEARKILEPVLTAPAASSARMVTAAGHAHIDTAWLWPVRETIRKCSRTFATAISLMNEYPDFHFIASQAQQYQWMKDHYPALYDQIREKIRAGSWEPVGSMWVEADCNIPSGESLIRQILYGKRFFRKEFGYETKDVWLPDVFGYSAALPQIMARSGIEFFLTQKLSWNDTNRFPHHTFYWEGIDGSRVFTHFPPADTYNGSFSMKEVLRAPRNFNHRSLYPFGYGDGGGGPTREMIETARRLGNLEGSPQVEMGRVSDFFTKAKEEARDLPVWSGELYLEYHRGTYTTQAASKRSNRKCEFLLRDAELWAALSNLATYPSEELEDAWKKLLLNQFHDIIPGSSINWVYRDAERSYVEITETAERVIDESLSNLAMEIDSSNLRQPIVVFNSLGHDRSEEVAIPPDILEDKTAARNRDGVIPIQRLADGSGLMMAIVPSVGFTTYDLVDEEVRPEGSLSVGDDFMENEYLRIEWDEQGLITSIIDKSAGRQVIPAGTRANVLHIHPDYPVNWDAWDLDPFYFETLDEITDLDRLEIVEKGPVRVAVEMVRSFGASSISQRMTLTAGSRQIDFHNRVDWQEDHRVLKVAFPVEVKSLRATYEIQFGHVERPTHQNTSWDAARFEVCAHKWADLSEAGYGVALFNDCKYGHDIRGNVMRLTLLRAPTWPDPEADRGSHEFSYALRPHAGDFRDAGIIGEAYSFNSPMRVVSTNIHAGRLPGTGSLFSTSDPGVVLETVKRLEDHDGIAVRFYESFGGHRETTIESPNFAASARLDLMEREVEEIPRSERLQVNFRPFEIATFGYARKTSSS